MNIATIDVYIDKTTNRFGIALAHAGYNYAWAEQAEQHERFGSPLGVIHICVWYGILSRAECETFALAWLGGQFKSTDLNDEIGNNKDADFEL